MHFITLSFHIINFHICTVVHSVINMYYRLAGAPDKWKFLKDGMNIIDVLAIMPYFLSLFFLNPESSM